LHYYLMTMIETREAADSLNGHVTGPLGTYAQPKSAASAIRRAPSWSRIPMAGIEQFAALRARQAAEAAGQSEG